MWSPTNCYWSYIWVCTGKNWHMRNNIQYDFNPKMIVSLFMWIWWHQAEDEVTTATNRKKTVICRYVIGLIFEIVRYIHIASWTICMRAMPKMGDTEEPINIHQMSFLVSPINTLLMDFFSFFFFFLIKYAYLYPADTHFLINISEARDTQLPFDQLPYS